MLATIGYERSGLDDFLSTLRASRVEILVDVRDRAQSRVPGYSKKALAAAAAEAGIEYIHVPALGDPKEGRDAARDGKFAEFRRIFGEVLETDAAKAALAELAALAQTRRICLMCFERDQRNCHRSIVANRLEKSLDIKAIHLGVQRGGAREAA